MVNGKDVINNNGLGLIEMSNQHNLESQMVLFNIFMFLHLQIYLKITHEKSTIDFNIIIRQNSEIKFQIPARHSTTP